MVIYTAPVNALVLPGPHPYTGQELIETLTHYTLVSKTTCSINTRRFMRHKDNPFSPINSRVYMAETVEGQPMTCFFFQ